MKYAQIRRIDISNGKGIGVSLFVQGCPSPHCKGCFNPETWDFNGGKEWTDEIKQYFFKLINNPHINHCSILGGEPLCEENIDDITKLVKECKQQFPNKKIWIWTRYIFEDYIKDKEIVKYADIIVDGRFVEELKDFNLKFRGSSNQRIIDVQESLKQNKVVLWED